MSFSFGKVPKVIMLLGGICIVANMAMAKQLHGGSIQVEYAFFFQIDVKWLSLFYWEGDVFIKQLWVMWVCT